MHALAGVGHRQEGQRVVPRVDAEEAQPDLRARLLPDELTGHAHRVTQAEAEHLVVEAQRLHVVGDREHHVAHALVAGDEPGGVRRDDRAGLVGDPVEDLEDVVEGVAEPDQLLHAALVELLPGAVLEVHAGLLQVLAHLLQGAVVGDLPAHAGQLVDVAGDDDQPGRYLVDAPVLMVGVRAAALGETEDLAGEGAPLLRVGAGDPDVAHGLDVDRHVSASVRRGGRGRRWPPRGTPRPPRSGPSARSWGRRGAAPWGSA